MAKKVIPPTLQETLEQLGMSMEEFATGVAKISRGMTILSETRLTHDTIVMLVAKAANVRQGDVERVLLALPNLESKFLKPERKP